jgi:hypothetical protein
MRFIIAPAIALMLAGCAGMSKDECLYADWSAIGYEDGAAGRPVSAVSPRRAACAKKAGITVDMAAYNAGREDGLYLYCRPSNGYAVGANGGRYYGVCASDDEDDFLMAFEMGRRLYSLEQNVYAVAGQIKKAQQDLYNTEHRITATQTALISPATPMADRPALLLEMKELYDDKEQIEYTLAALDRDLARAEAALADYEDHLALNGPLLQPAYEPRNARY